MTFENCVYDATGGVYCTYRGYPFHCTPVDTPDEWGQLELLIEAGDVEVSPYVEPPGPTPADIAAGQAAAAREKRDALLVDCDWVVNRHRDQIGGGVTTSLTDAQYQSWLSYRQQLRDISKQSGWPEEIAWPVSPPTASADQS
ncbi:TPA: tail fiber assembly protein [Burkholderia vietnamiensis]|nr:tail fiber assembly protein [Burkholderia vietnamiensis]